MENTFAPIKPVSKDLLYMKVADAINAYIRQNNLAPGDKIPAERVLAEQLKTGRNSVREALRVLENEGIIEVKTGRGAFVAQSSGDASIYFKMMKVNYLELLELKTILEKEAVRRLAKKADSQQLDLLESLLSDMEYLADSGLFSTAADRKFHECLLEGSKNKMLVQLACRMIDALDNYSKDLGEPNDIWLRTIPLHRELLDSIRNHDTVRACEASDQILKTDISVFNRLANH